MFEKRRREIAARRAEIRKLLAGSEPVDMDKLESELDALDNEERELDRREAATRRLNGGTDPSGGERGGHGDRGSGDDDPPGDPEPGPVNPINGRGGVRGESAGGGLPAGVDSRAAMLADLQGVTVQEAQARADTFSREHRMSITTDALRRSLMLSEGNIAQPTRVSGINPGPTEVSQIVDMVYIVDAEGMGEDSVAYEVPDALTAGVIKDDGNATTETLKGTQIAKITPVLITTLGYVSRRIQRTTPLNYQSRTVDAALRALRKKVGRLIVAGDPAAETPEITGILKAAAIQAGSDLEINAIDATTLRKIALSYGGDDAVEGGGVLLLNKKDLIAFGDVRGTNEKKAVYEIEFSEGSTTTGTIKDGGLAVRFCIDNGLKDLASAAEGTDYVMAYGKPLAYQLDLFGPYSVEVSRDYKFAEGLLAVMGEAMIGGNVISYNGFLRVKKKASE